MASLPSSSASMRLPNRTNGRPSSQRSSTRLFPLMAGPFYWQGTLIASSILKMWSSLRTSPNQANGLACKAPQLCGRSWPDATFKMSGATATRMATTSPIGILRPSRVRGLTVGWCRIACSSSAPPSPPPSSPLQASPQIIAPSNSCSVLGGPPSLEEVASWASPCFC